MRRACLFGLIAGFGVLAPSPIGAQILANPLEELSRTADQMRQEALVQKAQHTQTTLQEQQFVERYNELIKALSKFSSKYKSTHVIDIHAVESIRKAYRRLEEADPWFKVKGNEDLKAEADAR